MLPARFSTTGKRFPLKLRMLMRLRDPRGGGDRVVTRSLLLRRSPPSRALPRLARTPAGGRARRGHGSSRKSPHGAA